MAFSLLSKVYEVYDSFLILLHSEYWRSYEANYVFFIYGNIGPLKSTLNCINNVHKDGSATDLKILQWLQPWVATS